MRGVGGGRLDGGLNLIYIVIVNKTVDGRELNRDNIIPYICAEVASGADRAPGPHRGRGIKIQYKFTRVPM